MRGISGACEQTSFAFLTVDTDAVFGCGLSMVLVAVVQLLRAKPV
jgi:hypothetical protein